MMTTAPSVSVPRCSQVQSPTLPCGWSEQKLPSCCSWKAKFHVQRHSGRGQTSTQPGIRFAAPKLATPRPSVRLAPQLHPLPFPFCLPPLPCRSSLPLYQDPLGFTYSHKGTKEDKGLWTPLLGEKLPLHLVREGSQAAEPLATPLPRQSTPGILPYLVCITILCKRCYCYYFHLSNLKKQASRTLKTEEGGKAGFELRSL